MRESSPFTVCIGVDVTVTSGGGVLFLKIEEPSVFSILNICGTSSSLSGSFPVVPHDCHEDCPPPMPIVPPLESGSPSCVEVVFLRISSKSHIRK